MTGDMRGHEVNSEHHQVRNDGTIIEHVEVIENINVGHGGSLGFTSADNSQNVTITNDVSGDQKNILQLPNDADTIVAVIKKLLDEGISFPLAIPESVKPELIALRQDRTL